MIAINVFIRIPAQMKAKNNWVPRTGKRPYGKSNDPSTWMSFDEAVRRGRGLVCFALDGDGLIALDLDDCIDEGGKLHPNARKIIDLCQSYTEISLSGHGLHVFGFAKLPFTGRKKAFWRSMDQTGSSQLRGMSLRTGTS